MSRSAVIVIDVINTYEHTDANLLLPGVRKAVPALVRLLERARAAGVPVISSHDNFGEWRSHHGEIVETPLAGQHGELVEPLRPDEESFWPRQPAASTKG
ncbi:cysteine hydrolase family protein [Streptomyces anulatus]|uniref:cysteine hydrolase family protein n=1 Tax=Streptomyces sp. C3-3 TaxID=2824901 RepID=UPI001B3930B5|nr:isochorismatase family protein [Streptomyces sp. C3-3]MBQ1116441.1 isochorismatase family protein [Streptomyces sp. C3-3]